MIKLVYKTIVEARLQYVFAFFAFFSIVGSVLALATPLIYQQVIDRVIPTLDANLVTITIEFAIALAVISSVLGLLVETVASYFNEKLMYNLRAHFFIKVIFAKYELFQNTDIGMVINRLMSDVANLSNVVFLHYNIVLCVIKIGIYFSYGIYLNTSFAIIVALMGIFNIIITLLLKNLRVRYSKIMASYSDNFYSFLYQTMPMMKTIKANNMYQTQLNSQDEILTTIKNESLRQHTVLTGIGIVPTFIGKAFEMSLFIIAVTYMRNPEMSFGIGEYVSMTMLAGMMLEPIQTLSGSIIQLFDVQGSIERIEILDEKSESSGTKTFQGINEGGIKINEVSFSYDGKVNVLDTITMSIDPGMSIGIVGGSGSGKSTLANLMLGLYEIKHGEIRYNNVPSIAYDIHSLRNKVCLVSQNLIIFNESIRDNICMGLKDEPSDLHKIIDDVQLTDLIQKLPEGLETIAGENGAKLSGGEKQRVCVARILAKKPAVIILDEATSSLDPQNESIIKSNIEKLKRDNPQLITITISHKLEPLKALDLIYVLEKGKLVDSGTHNELVKKSTVYCKLFNLAGNNEF